MSVKKKKSVFILKGQTGVKSDCPLLHSFNHSKEHHLFFTVQLREQYSHIVLEQSEKTFTAVWGKKQKELELQRTGQDLIKEMNEKSDTPNEGYHMKITFFLAFPFTFHHSKSKPVGFF